MSKAYAMVTKEERHREVARGQEERSEQVVFAMQAGGKGKGPYVGERKNPIEKPPYSHCQKTNHDVTTCFELIGYPSWHPGSKRDFRRILAKEEGEDNRQEEDPRAKRRLMFHSHN